MKNLLIILLAIHHAVLPMAYSLTGIIMIVGAEAGVIEPSYWIVYGGLVAISALILKWGDKIAK